MKKLFYVFAAGMLVASCGSKNTEAATEAPEETTTETVEEEATPVEEEPVVEEESVLKPPFTVVAKRMTEGASNIVPLDTEIKEGNMYQINTYEFTVNTNGTWTGKLTVDQCNWRTNYQWINSPSASTELEGKWIVNYRTVGEGSEKVYNLKTENYTIYIPETGDCLWVGDWEGCRDLRTKSTGAYPIVEVTK